MQDPGDRPSLVPLTTEGYRRLALLCDTCREFGYFGVCTGAPGSGKSWAARHYTHWDLLDPVLARPHLVGTLPREVATLLRPCRSLVLSPLPPVTSHGVLGELARLRRRLEAVQASPLVGAGTPRPGRAVCGLLELVIVDDAELLPLEVIEELCRQAREERFGLVLLGPPQLETRILSRRALHCVFGFFTRFNALQGTEAVLLAHRLESTRAGRPARLRLVAPSRQPQHMRALLSLSRGNIRALLQLVQHAEWERTARASSASSAGDAGDVSWQLGSAPSAVPTAVPLDPARRLAHRGSFLRTESLSIYGRKCTRS